MKQGRSALRYAKAILDLAIEKNVDTEVNNDMKLISETIADSDDLNTMLKNPVIKAVDKTKVLDAIFGDKINNVTKGVFNLLQDNKRLEMLELVSMQYAKAFEQHKNIQVAKVTTAVALTKDLEKKVQEKIVALTGNSATIENIVDPAILGGFILRVGDLQYDASIANQFDELRKEFDNSQYISKI